MGDGPLIVTDITCPKCENKMLVIPDSDYQLYEVRTVGIICPNCLYTDRVDAIVLEREK